MLNWLLDLEIWGALVTLTGLEIILGVDNIVFISVVTSRLPQKQQPSARRLGLLGAVVTRLLLLGSIFWLTRLTTPLFAVFDHPFSVRDLILIGGGLFLLGKSTFEIHAEFDLNDQQKAGGAVVGFAAAITQIMILDSVFSLDSVITAIGMAERLWVMATAVVIAVAFMLVFVNAVSNVVERHPTLKMLALSFLVLIGVALIADGMGVHIPKGYIYFSMGFSVAVEMLNIRRRKPSNQS